MDATEHGKLPLDLVRGPVRFQAWRGQRMPGPLPECGAPFPSPRRSRRRRAVASHGPSGRAAGGKARGGPAHRRRSTDRPCCRGGAAPGGAEETASVGRRWTRPGEHVGFLCVSGPRYKRQAERTRTSKLCSYEPRCVSFESRCRTATRSQWDNSPRPPEGRDSIQEILLSVCCIMADDLTSWSRERVRQLIVGSVWPQPDGKGITGWVASG